MTETVKTSSTLIGFEKVYVGIYNNNRDLQEILEWKDDHGGTVNMKIAGLDADELRVRASNKFVWISKKGTGDVKVEFETFNPPYEDMMTILGRTKDQHNIHWAGEDTNPPYVSLLAVSSNLVGEKAYLGLPKGKLGVNDTEFATTEAKQKEPKNTKLSGTFVDKVIEGKSRVFGSCFGEDKFDKFKELIIGTVDSKSSKAVGSSLSSTPSSTGSQSVSR